MANQRNLIWIFIVLMFFIFFPVRHVFQTSTTLATGNYSDFTSISLYISDILIILLTISSIFLIDKPFYYLKTVGLYNGILIFWLILNLFWHFQTNSGLSYWNILKWLEFLVSYGTAYIIFSKTPLKTWFFRVFLTLASFESALALWQFHYQKSIGSILHKLGENVLNPNILVVAKIVSGETVRMRAYGTFPHPNLLSAFLLTGIFMALYLFLESNKIWEQVLLGLSLFLNILGLTVTFSRGSFLALGVGLLIFFGFILFSPSFPKRGPGRVLIRWLMIIMAISIIISFSLFRPYLSTRATISDSASLERIFYAKVGLQMVKAEPIFGV